DAVVVTGVRGSLARATELKRESSTVQDSISALELGKFPDDNVADSLSHITGVSISRTAGGEGQRVSVRGLGPEYTLTTFTASRPPAVTRSARWTWASAPTTPWPIRAATAPACRSRAPPAARASA